jgi:mRNA interferase HigB
LHIVILATPLHIISHRKINEAMLRLPYAASALDSWYRVLKYSKPSNFNEMKLLFNTVDRVEKFHVFNIGGNKIRLIAVVKYQGERIYIRHVLTHAEYDLGHWKKD